MQLSQEGYNYAKLTRGKTATQLLSIVLSTMNKKEAGDGPKDAQVRN